MHVPLATLSPDLADSDTFGNIVSQDMVLKDDFQSLPPVILETTVQPLAGQDSGCLTPSNVLAALQARSFKLSHFDLRLDW